MNKKVKIGGRKLKRMIMELSKYFPFFSLFCNFKTVLGN
jgi:hypothetical protein